MDPVKSNDLKSKVALAKCRGYFISEIKESLESILASIFPTGLPFKSRDKVFLNPNLLSPREPEKGVTTHPVFISAIVEILKDHGCRISIGDSPAFGKNIKELYAKTGISELVEKYGIETVVLQDFGIRELKLNNQIIPRVFISGIVYQADYVISLPKWKTHNLTVITAAVKNSYGLLPGVQKGTYHKIFPHPADFSDFLMDLYQAYKPDLFLLDGITAMDGEGPAGGRVIERNLVAGSTDAVALDSVLARIMGLNPVELDFLRLGREKGLGNIEQENIEISGANINNFANDDFIIPSIGHVRLAARVLPRFMVNLVKFFPEINRGICIKCGRCIETCPVKAISRHNGYVIIDHKTCIGCLCCKEVCPVDAVEIKKSAFFRFIKRLQKFFGKIFKRKKKKERGK